MSNRTASEAKQRLFKTSLFSRGTILQRSCKICGQHKPTGDEGYEGAKQSPLQRRAVNSEAIEEVPLMGEVGVQSPAILVQPKLSMSSISDSSEQEADRIADRVVTQVSHRTNSSAGQAEAEIPAIAGLSERAIASQQDVHHQGLSAHLEQSIQQQRTGGSSIAPAVRQPLEQAFGADFSHIRVHTDAAANQLNHQIEARAFTVGQDIFFRQGEYRPGSSSGQRLIAHELTHVLQQSEYSTPVQPMVQRQGWIERARRWGRRAEQWGERAVERTERLVDRAQEAGEQIVEEVEEAWNSGTGAISLIRFDGSRVELVGTPGYSARAVSGLMPIHPDAGGVDYTRPEHQNVPLKGPIPEGDYYVNPSEVESNPPMSFNTTAWGRYRTRLHGSIVTDIERRLTTERTGGFYLHQDANHNGTAGCIGIWNAGDNQRIHDLIRSNSSRIPVQVRYPSSSPTPSTSTPTPTTAPPPARSAPRRRRTRESVSRSPMPLTNAGRITPIPRMMPGYEMIQRNGGAPPAAAPANHFLVQAGIDRLQADSARYGVHQFPADYYDTISRHLFEVALQHTRRNYGEAFSLLDDVSDGDHGFAYQREYVRLVGTDSANGWDKVRHFTYTAYLQYTSGGFLLPEGFTYGKEIWDAVENLFGGDPEGYSIPDIRADNRGEAFAEEMRTRELRERRPRGPAVPAPVFPATGFGAGGGFRGIMDRDRRRFMQSLQGGR
ncbi:eCIS core domain-containing protein [Leptolyngbya ohadii]|uniref:eCIS core domain-containing protein n=1 Tax=Leptolyngbya ohadii TaxID=1962290 RepID=UPI000B59FA2E|nr:DUF4157 domain-containing protein [Leptolyngbya ohadii]